MPKLIDQMKLDYAMQLASTAATLRNAGLTNDSDKFAAASTSMLESAVTDTEGGETKAPDPVVPSHRSA